MIRALLGSQQRLLEIINLIYELDDRDAMLTALFARLREVLPFSSGVLLPIDCRTLELQGSFCFDCPAENTAPYLEHYAAFDPYVRRPPYALVLNEPAGLSDQAGFRELDRGEFADFMPKVPYWHALAAVVGFAGSPLAVFSVHRRRQERDFTVRDATLLGQIAPHLGRALTLRKWVSDPEFLGRQTGLLAFAADGGLLFANAAAQRLIPRGREAGVLAALPGAGSGSVRLDGLRYRVGCLPWRAASLLTGLAAHNAAAAGDADGRGGVADERAEDWERVKRLGAGLTIVSLTPFRQRDDLRRRLGCHGLSPREVEVTVQSVLGAITSAQLADRLRISEDTVKSHLQAAFRKVGVSSRIELLVKVLGLNEDRRCGRRRASDQES